MVMKSLNHIQGKNGSEWGQFIRETGTEAILLVAIDAAKYTHAFTIANYFGDILKKPSEFDASLTGFNWLKQEVIELKKQYQMKEVVVGIETTGHYYEDLVRWCQSEGFYVRTINSATTAEERKALLNYSKTDNIDLMVILQAIIHGRGTFNELPSGKIYHLQRLTRARRELVCERTALQNHIRVYMDQIFREFQGKSIWIEGKRKHVQPFSTIFGKTGCYLMRHFPHPSDILSLGVEGLRSLSQRENLKIRDTSIQLLVEFAEQSISQPKEELKEQIFLLSLSLDRLELFNEQITCLEERIEDLFIQTPGAVLLSIPGIGAINGAEFCAELGDISDFDHAGQLIKMAGTNPIIKQSGGRNPTYHRISKQGRRPLRNITFQVGKSISINNPEMRQKYLALKERGKHTNQAYVAIGNRMIRLAFSMIKKQTLYQSKQESYVLQNEIKKKLHKQNVLQFFEKLVAI